IPKMPLLRKNATGSKVLAIPFEKEHVVETTSSTPLGDLTVAGVDLNLTDFGVMSVTKGVEPLGEEARALLEKLYSKETTDDDKAVLADELERLYREKDIVGHEIARYFIDQQHLDLPKDEWFKKTKKDLQDLAAEDVKKFKRLSKKDYEKLAEEDKKEFGRKKASHGFFNVKRTLVRLQNLASQLQRKLDNYKNAHPENYKKKKKFWIMKKEWKMIWEQVENHHANMARQIATRIVSACIHHGVDILRFEDLKWSRPSKKKVAGYWLATWQVHWFHSKIIEHATAIAERKGIRVEQVVARNTSQRCSVCGRIGKRKGKSFTCEHCKSKNDSSKNRQLDSDLNASRNITIAPVSRNFLRAIGKRGGPASRAQQLNTAGLTITG
ncbi:MAG: zinc ribbon domain-containing protein, partial [Candidatus Odinarchaeota archaeon]